MRLSGEVGVAEDEIVEPGGIIVEYSLEPVACRRIEAGPVGGRDGDFCGGADSMVGWIITVSPGSVCRG